MTGPEPTLDLGDQEIRPEDLAVRWRRLDPREQTRSKLVWALLVVVVLILLGYSLAGALLGNPDEWQRVNSVLGGALTTFLTLLGGAIGFYFSEQTKKKDG